MRYDQVVLVHKGHCTGWFVHGLLADFFARVFQRNLASGLGQSESMRVTEACVRLLRIRICIKQVPRLPQNPQAVAKETKETSS